MILPQGKRRFSLTLPIVGFALLDVAGMVAFAVGLAYLTVWALPGDSHPER